MKKIEKFVAICLLLPFLFVGCSIFVKNTYKTEYATGAAYNLAAITVKNLKDTGKITPEQLDKIYKIGGTVYASYQVSVDALIGYYQAPTDDLQTILSSALSSLAANWGDLVALVNSIVPGSLNNALVMKGITSSGQTYTVMIKQMADGTLQIIIQVGAIVLQYAIQEGINIITALQKSDITIDDLKILKTMIKPLEQY